MDKVRIAAVAPGAFRGQDEYRNAAQAVAYVDEAVQQGARLVVFPEGYPGPCNGPMDSGNRLTRTPLEMLREAGRRHRVYIACGDLEETGFLPDTYYLCQKLISPDGEILANYRRCQPTPPATNAYLYSGRRHVLPGDEFAVVETELGRLGLIICSEIFVPELARVEMLMGAEVLLAPIGGSFGRAKMSLKVGRDIPHPRAMMSLWKCMAQARAAENLMCVVIAANVWEKESTWGACIASPERVLAESEGAGIAYATLDMEQLRRLRARCRSEEDYADPPVIVPPLVCPGQHRDRRPELYAKLVEPQPDAFDFFYHRKGLERWQEFNRLSQPGGARTSSRA